jgi:AraC-like DNA-binding protein
MRLARGGGPGAGLAVVAYRAGYADQAHLSREVRALAGVSPTELLLKAV